MPSVLWRCWLGGRKGIWPVKNWVVGCWHGYLSGAWCRLAYDPADATATLVSCFSKIQIGFTFLVPAHLGSPDQGPLNVCVCVLLLCLLAFLPTAVCRLCSRWNGSKVIKEENPVAARHSCLFTGKCAEYFAAGNNFAQFSEVSWQISCYFGHCVPFQFVTVLSQWFQSNLNMCASWL